MNQIQQGRWAIESIIIDSMTVMNFDGFEYLEFSDGEMSIQPVGFQFTVNESTSKSAILKSRGRVYFVEFEVQDDDLKMKMSRPEFSETFEVTAHLQEAFVAVS